MMLFRFSDQVFSHYFSTSKLIQLLLYSFVFILAPFLQEQLCWAIEKSSSLASPSYKHAAVRNTNKQYEHEHNYSSSSDIAARSPNILRSYATSSSSRTTSRTTSTTTISTPSTTTTTPSTTPIPNLSKTKESKKNYQKTKQGASKKITQFIDKVDSQTKSEIDKALARFFFGCNIPFSVVDSDHFKSFIRAIRPSYVPPCRQTLSTTLLDEVSEELLIKNKKNSPKATTLIIDGWKNSSNNTKNVVTMLQKAGGQSTFLESYDFSDLRETGEMLAEICESSIEIARNRYGSRVYAVVSDNASNMMKMGRLTELWHSTCSSHTANLLAKDVIKVDVLNKMSSILKEYKHSNLEKALIDNGGTRIILPVETRWCSQRDACKCFIKNLLNMKKISAEGYIKVKAEVTYLLYNEDFINEIKEMIQILEPICQLVNKCQKSDFSVADAVEEWFEIKQKMPEHLMTDMIEAAIDHRIQMAGNIYSFAANYLHPRYKGRKLNVEQKSSVEMFLLDQLDSEGLNGLNDYEHEKDIFQKLFQKKISSYDTFWGLAETKFPTLADVAQKLLNIPASSAQLERLFSNWSFVHSSLRNRLSPEKSSKLMYIYYSLKLRDTNNSNDY